MGKRSGRQISNFVVGQDTRTVVDVAMHTWSEWFTYSVVVVGGTTGIFVKRKSNAWRAEQSASPAMHVQKGSHSV